MTVNLLESAAYRQTQDTKRQVVEAWKLVREGADGSKIARAQLSEAVTTHDFPRLLAQGLQEQVTTTMQQVSDETTAIARMHQTRDFREVRYRDLFLSAGPMNRVLETEEYKSRDPFAETFLRFASVKFGNRYGMSWEAIKNDEWDYLLQLPQLIAQDATATHNDYVFGQMIGEDGQPSESFFPEIENLALTHENLRAVRRRLLRRRFQVGSWDRPADFSQMVLIVTPSQEDEARFITDAGRVTEIQNPNGRNRLEREVQNPLGGVTVQVSEEFFSKLAPELRDTAWALLPGASTRNPALVRGRLRGHPDVEVRVKNDTGNYVGGGPVPHTEGNYGNDTIDFRGRTTGGVATGFNYGVREVDKETGNVVPGSEAEPLVYFSRGTDPVES